ncbi:hypothetical protein L249_1988 [Ophiocordyceps polyrhachis-furcata BCC 54312]|uniref:C2H2-type domain-containing protein n=1 Tax=Ophiocordyceps polyrhachis-furcata BCC 54312 TaxID=1330021 RepID=A0A367LPU9_9HYPO|nr:hypothetical protein L249_1988 [Ophiocordyceps polyrhachis-furcata BCC 54312]
MAPNEYFECGTCGKEFLSGWQARDNHCSSTGHSRPDHECDTCHRHFRTEAACSQHMNDTCHWTRSESDVAEHHHDAHNYCSDCRRFFADANAFKMHLRSRQHLGSNVACPFCSKTYTTATGVTHHLESGSCPCARCLDRDQIYRIIGFTDADGFISNNLRDWKQSYDYAATERCFNGHRYECFLCDRQFNRMSQLTQHLNSPTHQMALYHCPNAMCRQEFKSLAGIINHFESEACGVTTFENIQGQMDGLFRSGQLLSL